MYSFSYLEPVCSMSSSNCCFLTCIQVSQEVGQAVWYSHLFQNFPQFIVHTVKGFGLVNKAEIVSLKTNSDGVSFPQFEVFLDSLNLVTGSKSCLFFFLKVTSLLGSFSRKYVKYQILNNCSLSVLQVKNDVP